MIRSNFHTHTCFCDGNNTPEEIVQAAIEKGFTAIGFSGHCYCPLEKWYSMKAGAEEYKAEIKRLKTEYADRIRIFCGIEKNCFAEEDTSCFDYVIGSVHFVPKSGEYCEIDESAEIVKDFVEQLYGGNFDLYAEDYFALVSNVVKMTDCDIIGHIDLVSKFSEELGFSESNRFLASAEKAVKKLIPFGKPFEINTGAMARGVRSIPYPSPEILKMIKENGGRIIISSDCHDKKYLDFAFEQAQRLAIDCGFTEYGEITENGIEYTKF